MPVVVHDQPLSMGWCLDCHRHPEDIFRPPGRGRPTSPGSPRKGRLNAIYGLFLKDQSRIHASGTMRRVPPMNEDTPADNRNGSAAPARPTGGVSTSSPTPRNSATGSSSGFPRR